MRLRKAMICTAVSLGGLGPQAYADNDSVSERTLAEVQVKDPSLFESPSEQTGAYRAKTNTGALGLNLSAKETPQSVSVVTRALMEDFNLTSANAVLDTVAGVTVEKVETDRTYFVARGFDVTNFQVDGIGLPLNFGLLSGDWDTAIYDRVEVVRGATGLMAGTGNPSATVNFIRKRPTAAFRGTLGATYGSWNDLRLEADVSGPVNAAGTLRGRLTAVAQDRDSYLDRYHNRKEVFNGMLEADLGERTLFTLGHSRQENRPSGVLWGALPLYYTDGSLTDYDVSTSTAAKWSYWANNTNTTFAELTHAFDSGWEGKASYSHTENDQHSKLLYVYGTPDRSTGLGLAAWPSKYTLDNSQDLLDLRANGSFDLGGRRHEAIVGTGYARSRMSELSLHGASLFASLPGNSAFDGSFPEPLFNIPGGDAEFLDRQGSVYAATRLNPADNWKLILGANVTTVDSKGHSYGAAQDKSESNTTPYWGVVYGLTPTASLYASHTRIFKPQVELDTSLNRLAPVKGSNSEVGMKADLFGGRPTASVALFKTRQDNLASAVGTVGVITVYDGVDTRSRGVELELAGEILPRLKLSAGYTTLSLEDETGQAARTFIPRQLLRLSTTYAPQADGKLKLGATLNVRSETHADFGGITVKQSGYALLGLMARYELNPKLTLGFNINNVTDRKYLTSLYWGQSYYAQPRSMSANATWKF